MAKDNKEIKIFSLNRIKFNELYEDALSYIKASYKAVGLTFNTASPFGQLLKVVLHLGRMIFYYIEDSITGLNIRTAYRPDQVKGLAMLAGHDAARPIAARGACRIYYVDNGDYQLNGTTCYIPNKTTVVSKLNGYTYTILLGADNGKITLQSGNYLEASLILGTIKLQAATGTGTPLQSFNFAERNFAEVDLFYMNVYVNSEPWEIVKSIIDLGYNQKGCIVRTGINGGLDVFFGNGYMGAIPEQGSSIIVEYLVTDSDNANLTKEYVNSAEYWEFDGEGTMQDGSVIKLEKNFKIQLTTDIIFGTLSEDTALTQLIAPHISRSFVLGNEANYRYFFRRMNMFSDVEIIRGSYTVNGTSIMRLAYDEACDNYNVAHSNYRSAIDTYGSDSNEVAEAYIELQKAGNIKEYTSSKLTDNTYQDNTVYIFLVPDIKKRISSVLNYFNCEESLFYLSKDELENIINLINDTKQRIITVENRLIQPKIVRFSVNVQAKIWDNYDEELVYTAGLNALSNYLINFNRKDIIPVSDIVSIFENEVDGIDSVNVWFDADVENQKIYGKNNFYGLDSYGDIVLTRTIIDANGQYQNIRDIMPLIRGGFTSPSGIEYSNIQTKDGYSAFNLIIDTNKSTNRKVNLNNYTPLT